MENDALDLGTEFFIGLLDLADNRSRYSVPQLLSALNATTSLTELEVFGYSCFVYKPHVHSRVVEPICRCLASLRLQNEDHPLKTIDFDYVHSAVVRQFLVALKQFGILEVKIRQMKSFSVQLLVDFCRDNSNLKVLELESITFTDEVALPPNDPSGDSAIRNLDKVILKHIEFETPLAANNFAHFVEHLSVSALVLGVLQHEQYCEFKMPSVEHLTLCCFSEIKHFQAALDAGMSSLKRLTVDFVRHNELYGTTEKLESLIRMIRGAVILNSLTIHNCTVLRDGRNPLRPPRQLFEALEACASVTEIHVNNDGDPYDFTEPEVQQLRRITARNRKLGRFLANPSTFPNAKLLTLMRQFNDCPSGLYMLTRRLPEMFSFLKGSCLFLSMEPIPTRQLRKRRKISYKD